MTPVVVATRSPHKTREIRELVGRIPGLELLDLTHVGLPETSDEAGVEAFDTFEENALAKARFFAARTPHPVLADDSGLCVDALGGAPGVFSKRFAGRDDLSGLELDQANNHRLLQDLRSVPDSERIGRYVCVIAIVDPTGDEHVFRGTVDGLILREPRGTGGFGYDPLFFVPSLAATFAEVPPAAKNRISHRARAVEAAIPHLRNLAEHSSHGPPQR